MANKRQQHMQNQFKQPESVQNTNSESISDDITNADSDIASIAQANFNQVQSSLNKDEAEVLSQAVVEDDSSITEANQPIKDTTSFEYEDLPNHVEEQRLQASPESLVVDMHTLQIKLSTSAYSTLQSIMDYIDGVRPNKPMTEQEFGRYQTQLWTTLKSIMTLKSDEEFTIVFREVLKLWHAFDGVIDGVKQVFHPDMIARYPQAWTLSDLDHTAFRRFIALLGATADPKTRYIAFKDINTGYVFQYGYTEEMQNRVIGFYQAL